MAGAMDMSKSALFQKMREKAEAEQAPEQKPDEGKSEDEIFDELLAQAGWTEEWNQESKKEYYFNAAGETQWDRRVPPPAPARMYPSRMIQLSAITITRFTRPQIAPVSA